MISHIEFTNLQELNFRECGLTNIEIIPYLKCPNLKSLIITRNLIVSLKPLTKIYFKQL
jgi:hypothetical protein